MVDGGEEAKTNFQRKYATMKAVLSSCVSLIHRDISAVGTHLQVEDDPFKK